MSEKTLCTQKNYILYAKKNFFRKFDLRLKKNRKIVGTSFQNYLKNFFCRHQKMPVIQFPHMENVWIAFFSKKKTFQISFFLSPVCSTVLKKPQKWFNFFSIVFQKCMKFFMTSIFSIYLMYDLDIKPSYCFDFCNESNGIFGLGVVLFLQTNFDFLTSHF